MAGTITATVKKRISIGGTDYLYLGTLTPDNSYATGGDTITAPAAPALTLPEKIDYFGIEGSVAGHLALYNAEAAKVKLFEGAAGVLKEVANAANLSAETFNYVCIGC